MVQAIMAVEKVEMNHFNYIIALEKWFQASATYIASSWYLKDKMGLAVFHPDLCHTQRKEEMSAFNQN